MEKVNRDYWKTIIGMASASGMEKEEWCRQNGIAINTFRKYEELIKKGGSKGAENLLGTGYAEIPLSTNDKYGKDGDIGKTSDNLTRDTHLCVNGASDTQGIILEIGKIRLHIYEGIREATLETVVKVVMGIA